jgi:hypothetical protein
VDSKLASNLKLERDNVIQLSLPPDYGTSVSCNLGALGIVTGTFLGTDTTSCYGYVAFTSGSLAGQTLLLPFQARG